MIGLNRSRPRSRAPDLARLPIVVNARAISLSEGIRAGLSVAVIIALSEYFTFPPLREAALAALLTCLCDPGGPIRRRVPVLLSFALVGAAITVGFGLLREFGPIVALPLGVFGIFCSSFVRIYGQAPQQAGVLLGTVQILSLDYGIPTFTRAGTLAAAFIAGALWAILLTMVIWRIHPFLPARRAVAEAYRKLSHLIRDLHALVQTPSITEAAWEAHARIHRRAARDAIEAAQAAVMDVVRSRGASSNRAAQAVIRLETADQIFGSLIALSDMLEYDSPAERKLAERILRRMRPVLLTLAQSMLTDDPDVHYRIDRSIDGIVADLGRLPAGTPLRTVFDRITERLRIALTLSVPANITPGVDSTGRPIPFWQRMMRPPRANLNWKSPALRHALRTAVTAALPLALTMFWFTPYDHWLTMTVVATMQPYYSLTYTRAVERVAGTTAGGIIAAAVGLVCTTPLAIAGAMFPLAMLAFAVRAVSFGLFMMALTPLVVLLVETGAPGADEWMIAFARAAFTILGGLIAVAANFLLWPSREPDLVAEEVRKAIAAHGLYAEADFSALLGDSTGSALGPARREAGVASNALEALITRALLEPGKKKQDPLEAAMVIDAALRRCAGRLARLQHDPAMASGTSAATLRVWRDWISASMRLLASGRTDLAPRPTETDNDTLVRLARQIELMAGAMERLR
jgi:uncharacterized membrane protein YccC